MIYLLFCSLLMFFSSLTHNKSNPEDLCIQDLSEDILFVGLGSSCQAADVLRSCEVRKAAFPFDWILSSDGEKLIELLDWDFFNFLETPYLIPSKSSNEVLLQTHYHMEFHHEGVWRGEPDYLLENKEKLTQKYQKRINRFRELKEYPGKVFFIRFANKYSLEPNVFYRLQENLEITDSYALRLHDALKRYFPGLDFYLIVVNVHNQTEIWKEKQLLSNLLMIRANPVQLLSTKKANYTKLFNELISQENALH